MLRLALLSVLGVGLMACQTDLRGATADSSEPTASVRAPDGIATEPIGGDDDDSNADGPTDGDPTDGDPTDGDPTDGEPTDSNPGDTSPPSDDVVPPAQTEQACSVWQDCGPHFGDRNSGFDCQDGQCACNVAGDYDEACAAIGGLWSDAQCFCFVTASRPPAEADPDETDHVTCWWDYYEDCEADEWVDTSYYRNECDDDGCRRVYVRRGYWRKGHCDDVWVRECSDGTRQEFR